MSRNDVVYEKKKGASQVTSGSTVPSVLNESPFADSINENGNNVNGDNKFPPNESLPYPKRQAIISKTPRNTVKLLISLTKGITLPTERSFRLKLLTDLQASYLHKQKADMTEEH